MGSWGERLDLGSSSGLFDALTAGAADAPESRLLDALVGDWRSNTAWEALPGAGVRMLIGRSENRWIFGGRVLELRSFVAAGVVSAVLLCAFDPTNRDYVAFTVHALSTWFVLERGRADEDGRGIAFDAVEPVPDGRPGVPYRRTLRFDAADTYTASISYPGSPPGANGSLVSIHHRIG
jgi:hypothetical protein